MKEADTFEGQALMQEREFLRTRPAHSVGARPCRVCGKDHRALSAEVQDAISDPKDKIIADLLAALGKIAWEGGAASTFKGIAKAAIAAAKVGVR